LRGITLGKNLIKEIPDQVRKLLSEPEKRLQFYLNHNPIQFIPLWLLTSECSKKDFLLTNNNNWSKKKTAIPKTEKIDAISTLMEISAVEVIKNKMNIEELPTILKEYIDKHKLCGNDSRIWDKKNVCPKSRIILEDPITVILRYEKYPILGNFCSLKCYSYFKRKLFANVKERFESLGWRFSKTDDFYN